MMFPTTEEHQQDMAAATAQPRHVQSALSKPDPSGVVSAIQTNEITPSLFAPASHASSEQLEAGNGVLASSRPDEADSQQADSSSVGSSNMQSGTVRNMYLSLAAHNGSLLDSFLQGVADPSEWEVYVWQTPEGPPQGDAAQQYLQVVRRWQQEVGQFVSFTEAAGELHCWSLCNVKRHVS